MKTWTSPNLKQILKRRLIGPLLAVVLAASFGVYEAAKPIAARAAVAQPTATPLDDNSVSALLSLDHAMETLAARVTPAIVNVTVTSRTNPDMNTGISPDDNDDDDGGPQSNPFGPFFGPNFRPQPRIEHGLGSGVIISPDGYIVTNDHVVDGSLDIRVTMSDRRILPAKLIGKDPLTDLAVIKVNETNLPNAPWGDSTQLRPGQTVLAFGNPYGFRFTVTRGIVSAVNRPNPYATDRRKPGQFIQTDAAINPGNSGGPLVNARGEVVGINTFLISSSGGFSGMGFAIPSQIVRPTVESLIKTGKMEHGYMGIGISDVTPENSRFFDVNSAAGAVVTQVEPNSPGAKAGLKTGDVIAELDGKKVSDAGELQAEVGLKHPGTTIRLGILRNGKSETLPVTLEEMGARNHAADNNATGERGKARWGLGLGDLTPDVRQQLRAPDSIRGAVVEQVQPGSAADNAGLQRGDIILEVNRKPVQSASDVKQALSSVVKGQDALVLVWSNGGNTFRVLHAPQAG